MPFGHCALVGGSPSVLREPRGAEIDAHDSVLRVNAHGLAPALAPHVGRRTTAFFLVGTEPMMSVARNRSLATGAIFAPRFHAAYEALRREQMPDRGGPQLLALAGPCVRYRARRIALRPPTTGLEAVLFALLACDSVDLYGFGEASMPDGSVHVDAVDVKRERHARQTLFQFHGIAHERQLIRKWTANAAKATAADALGVAPLEPRRPRLRLMPTRRR